MSHYAQVVDGIVQTVLVIDDTKEDVKLLESLLTGGGKLIKASFNTRNGVHYGQDGKPDGGEALRWNYPQAGYVYDEKLDAFYTSSTKPVDTMYFCKDTLTWKQPLENRAIRQSTGSRGTPKKVYLTEQGFKMFGPQVLDNLERSLNLAFIQNLDGADLALPMTERETLLFAQRPEFDGLRPMTERQMLNITDRLAQQRLGMPVLPAWQGRTKEEVLALGDQPLFVKRQRTYAKDTHPMAYTSWKSAADFVNKADDAFWALQASPEELYGEFIFQPLVAHPFSALDLRFAVNKDSEIHVFCESLMTYDAVEQLGQWQPFSGDCTKEKEDIARIVKEQGLKPGLHLLQYTWYNDQWVLMDWNTRLAAAHIALFPSVYPVLNDAFSWMLGLPLYHEAKNLYWEQRPYKHLGLGREVEALIGQAGLFPRWSRTDKLHRIAAIGTSKREVEERYARFDHLLTQRSVKS